MADMLREEQHAAAGQAYEPLPLQQQPQLALSCVPDDAMGVPAPPQGAAFVPFQLSDEMCTLLP